MDQAKLQELLTKNTKPKVEEMMLYLLDRSSQETNKVVNVVFPCGDIHGATTALISSTCSDRGILNRFFGWALALMITVVLMFVTLVGIFSLWCTQSHQIQRFYGSFL